MDSEQIPWNDIVSIEVEDEDSASTISVDTITVPIKIPAANQIQSVINNLEDSESESELDMSSRTDFAVEKLRGSDNYHDWCFAMTNYLTMKGWNKCIELDVSPAESATALAAATARVGEAVEKDATKLNQAKACLALSVEATLFVHIRECSTRRRRGHAAVHRQYYDHCQQINMHRI